MPTFKREKREKREKKFKKKKSHTFTPPQNKHFSSKRKSSLSSLSKTHNNNNNASSEQRRQKMRVDDDGANPAFGWSSGRRGPPESDVAPIEEEEEEDDDDVKAIQRLCDLTERIEKARDANQFRVAMELMREQLGLFETRATLSEEERKMMEPLIQTVLGDIEEVRGKARREGEKEESKEKNAGGFTAAALPQTKTTTKTTPVPKAEEARSNTLVEVDKNIVLTSVISPTTKPATGGAPPAARRSARGEKQEDNNNNNNNNNENRNKTTTNVLETKAAWGIPAGDEEEENKEEEEEFFRAVDVAKQQKHQEEQKKSYGDLKKEKEAREQKEKEEERNNMQCKKTLTKMEQLQADAKRQREAQPSIPIQRVVNYGKPSPSIHEEKRRLVTSRTIDPREEEEKRSRRQSPRKKHGGKIRGRTSGALRYRVDDEDDNGMMYNGNNTRKRGKNKKVSVDALNNDDDDDNDDMIYDNEHHRGNVTPRAKPKTARFITAGDKLDFERAQKGLSPLVQPFREERAKEVLKAGGGGRSSVPGAPGGFIGPFGHLNGGNDNNNNSGQQKNKDDRNGDSSPAFSELALKRLQPTGKEIIPDEILKLERDIVERVIGEVLDKPGTVSWDSIVGLEHAKNAVQELAVWPMTNPELFTGARAVPKGLLLFGPPGTGKTMIGKAVASQCKATFFSISASSLTSKWIGDGEKMVRALFAVARHCAPSVIFVDEIDSLLSARKSEGEHESSRRMKTEFLVQMDGLGGEDPTKPMLLIGATNRPQELDDGARRRLAKQLYIPLPCAAARRDMILKTLNPDGEGKVKHALSEKDLDVICEKTDGYSGSDLKNLVQEAARAPLRELFAKKKSKSSGEKGDGGVDIVDLTKSGEDETQELREIRIDDIRKAAKQVRASVTRDDIEFHEDWNKKHGALTANEVEDDGEW